MAALILAITASRGAGALERDVIGFPVHLLGIRLWPADAGFGLQPILERRLLPPTPIPPQQPIGIFGVELGHVG